MTTQIERVESALVSGRELTAKQMVNFFGLASTDAARSTVSAIRRRGVPVYLNTRKDSKGRVTRKYRVGAPSKAVIAAGFRALAAA